MSPQQSSRGRAALGLGCVLVLLLGWLLACRISSLRMFVPDDSYITYIYGRNLADDFGLRYNAVDSEPTEGFSSFLHVLLVAGAVRLGFDPLAATRASSLLLVLSNPIVCGLVIRRIVGISSGISLLAAVGVYSVPLLLPETGMHIESGMDTILFAAVNGFAFVWAVQFAIGQGRRTRPVYISGVLILFALTLSRPEGLFLAVGYLASGMLLMWWAAPRGRRAESLRAGAIVGLGFACSLGALLVWKLRYFGYLLPNPYYVKSNDKVFGSAGVILPGIPEVIAFLKMRYLPAVFLGTGVVLWSRPSASLRRAAILLLPSFAVVLLYARGIHEVTYGYRYEYPQLLPLAGCIALWIADLWRRRPKRFLILVSLAIACGPLLDLPSSRAALSSARQPVVAATLWTDSHPYDAHAKLAYDLAETGLGERASMLTGSAGLIPYYSRFVAIDWSGLNNNRLSGRYPLTMDEVWDYIDSVRPDVLITTLPPATQGFRDRREDPAFRAAPVQREFGILAGPLFRFWNRNRVEEMFYREMSYIRDHYRFGACYALATNWALIAYVRRDSAYAREILHVLGNSERADWNLDLSRSYVNDPRGLNGGSAVESDARHPSR